MEFLVTIDAIAKPDPVSSLQERDRKSLSCLVYNRCDHKTFSLPAPYSLLPIYN
ncbi:MAG: hypothetical protein F6J90_18595 [Moorea sp. SIOASIH]|uniref:hypothetical protein n=1 Tax=Moorena sp. SIOASIH TaxID=2607817 RepID=UPI0013B943CB|nr:hypothetical protein [Moorena sp. SIOASIH]NEO38231.1 hypothetical protein [Moorena sp. SIOASIH]